MKKPLLTKRQRALQELEHASQSLNHALSLLGGRTRHKPHVVTRQFIARQYLESLVTRLAVVNDLVLIGDKTINALVSKDDLSMEVIRFPGTDSLGALSPAFPRDDFEAAYDKERHTGADNATS